MYHMYFEIWSCSISSAPYELMKRKSVRPLLLKRCVQSTMSGDMHYTETVWVSEWVCYVLCDIIWLLKTQCTIYISCAHFFLHIPWSFSTVCFLSLLFFHLLICYSNHLIPAIGTVTEESKWLKINWITTIHMKYASRFGLCVVTRHMNLCFWRECLRSGLWFSIYMPPLVLLLLLLIDQM